MPPKAATCRRKQREAREKAQAYARSKENSLTSDQTPRIPAAGIKDMMNLVDLLHGALSRSIARDFLGLGLLGGLGLFVDVQAERDELVDALGEAGRFLDGEARNKERGLEQELGDRLNGAVVLAISLDLFLELFDNGRLRRDLEGLLGGHVRAHRGVAESLGLHNTLHVGGPAELTGTDGTRRADELVADHNLLDLVTQDILESLSKTLELLLLSLASLLLLLGLFELKVLGDVDKLLAIELLELRHGVLINGVNQEQNLEVLLLKGVKEGRLGNGLERLAGDVVNVLLVLGHASDIIRERCHIVTRLG